MERNCSWIIIQGEKPPATPRSAEPNTIYAIVGFPVSCSQKIDLCGIPARASRGIQKLPNNLEVFEAGNDGGVLMFLSMESADHIYFLFRIIQNPKPGVHLEY